MRLGRVIAALLVGGLVLLAAGLALYSYPADAQSRTAALAPADYTARPAARAATGRILWQFASDGAVNSGAAVVDGTVYWGSGYSHLLNAFGISGTPKLSAFSLK